VTFEVGHPLKMVLFGFNLWWNLALRLSYMEYKKEKKNVHVRYSLKYSNARKEDGWGEGQQGTKSIC